MPTPSPASWLRLIGLGLIWGASFLSVEVALADFGPLTIAALRITLAAAMLLAVARLRGVRLPRLADPSGGRIWAAAFGIALASNAVPFSLLSWSQKSVASGFAGVSMAMVPLIILPLAHAFVPGEQMNLRRLAGFLIGTLGVVVLIGPGAFDSTGAEGEMLARLACVAAAGCYATGAILTRRCPEVGFLALSALVMLLAAAVLLPVALLAEGLPGRPGLLPLAAVLYLGLLPTGVAQLLLVRIVREAGPTFMSLVNYQVPLWSVLLGALVLAEPLPPSLFLALGLILAGLALSQLGALRRLFGRR
jgi:drug/metabolite transporter (DMT)-like permease